MAQVFLHISNSLTRVLNNDLTTVLRSITLIQGETYTFNLAFYEDASAFVPDLSAFTFSIRAYGSATNLVSASSVTTGTGDFPYSFSLKLSSPTLTAVLGSENQVNLLGYITYTVDGDEVQIEPFTIRTINTASLGDEVDYVVSINGLEGTLGLTGSGSVSVTQSGSTINIEGTAPEVDLTAIEADIAALQAASSTYYLASNPSNFITVSALAPYALKGTNTDITSLASGIKISNGTAYWQISPALNSAQTIFNLVGSDPAYYLYTNGSEVLRIGANTVNQPGAFTSYTCGNQGYFEDARIRYVINQQSNVGLSDGGAANSFALWAVNKAAHVNSNGMQLLGTPTAPTASAGTNTTQIATTAFVKTADDALAATCVRTTGNQTIAGTKTFSSSVIAQQNLSVLFAISAGSHIYTSSNLVAPYIAPYNAPTSPNIDLNNHNLIGDWKINSVHPLEFLKALGTLTKIIPAVPGDPATKGGQSIEFTALPVDGDIVTLRITQSGADSYVSLEFDSDSSVSEGNSPVDISGISTPSDAATAFASAISGLSGLSDVYASGSSTVFYTANPGSSEGVGYNVLGTTFTSSTSGYSNGGDGTPGDPEIGFRTTNLTGTYSNKAHFITNIFAQVGATAWVDCDIEIGYLYAGTFYRIFLIPLANLTSNAILTLGNGIIQLPEDFANLQSMPSVNYSLLARTAISGAPADETTGESVTLIVQGITK